MNNLPALPAQDRKRPIPRKVREAVGLIVGGQVKTIQAAAKRVGLSREYLSRSLGEPHVAEFLRQKAARAVALGAGRAAARLNQLIDAKSEHVSLDASRHALATAGIGPANASSVNVDVTIRAGYVIDLTRRKDRVSQDAAQTETKVIEVSKE